MTTPRRRVIRPSSTMPSPPPRRLLVMRHRLEREQRLLATWMIRLKRAFHGFEKYQRRTARLERQVRSSHGSPSTNPRSSSSVP